MARRRWAARPPALLSARLSVFILTDPDPTNSRTGWPDELISELEQLGALHRRQSTRATITFQYDVSQLGRWLERKVEAAGIQVLLGAVLTEATFSQRRVGQL